MLFLLVKSNAQNIQVAGFWPWISLSLIEMTDGAGGRLYELYLTDIIAVSNPKAKVKLG